MTFANLFVKPDEYSSFPLDDSLVVIREGVERLFILNETAQIIWEMALEGLNPDKMALRLADLFGIPSDKADTDISQTLDTWRTGHLIGDKNDPDEGEERSTPIVSDLSSATIPIHSERHYLLGGVPFTIRFATLILEINVHRRISRLEAKREEGAPTLSIYETPNGGYQLMQGDKLFAVGKELINVEPLAHSWLFGVVYPNRRWLITLHAAAVSDGKSAIVFPAYYGSGKSIMSLALIEAGYTYFSDDIVPVTFDFMAAPFPVNIGLKEPGWDVARRYYKAIDDAPRFNRTDGVRFVYHSPPQAINAPLLVPTPIKKIVFLRYTAEAKTKLTQITPVEALSYLTNSESKILPEPERVGQFVEWVKTTPSFTLEYENLDEAVPVIRDLFPLGQT